MRDLILVGLSAKARTGKSTAAEILRTEHDFVEVTLKNEMVRVLAPLFDTLPSTFEEGKDEPSGDLFGRTPRHVMQSFGTDWAREQIDKDFWIVLLHRSISRLLDNHRKSRNFGKKPLKIVVSDIRFDNEAQYILDMDGTVLQLVRTGYMDRTNVEGHASEEGISSDLITTLLKFQVSRDGDVAGLRQRLKEWCSTNGC